MKVAISSPTFFSLLAWLWVWHAGTVTLCWVVKMDTDLLKNKLALGTLNLQHE